MSKQVSPAAIGGFTVGAVVLVVAALLIFGSGQLFTTTHPYVLYFDGAINGLQVGAPVQFQGVQVGTVTGIKATIQAKTLQVRIPVFIEVTEGSIEQVGGSGQRRIDQRTGIRLLVERGMRAQLQLQSFVTGVLFVQFDFHPDEKPAVVAVDTDSGLLELPTIPTTFEEVSQTIRTALKKLGKLPLKQLFTDLLATVQGIEKLVNSPEVTATIKNFDALVQEVQRLVKHIDEIISPTVSTFNATVADIGHLVKDIDAQIEPVIARLEKTVEAAQAAIDQARDTLAAGGSRSPLRHEVTQTLEEVRQAARAIRVLAHELQRQPDALLRGKGKPKR